MTGSSKDGLQTLLIVLHGTHVLVSTDPLPITSQTLVQASMSISYSSVLLTPAGHPHGEIET